MVEVASLDEAPLRSVWRDEARDFTPWLAANPGLLGKELQMDLELEGKEVAVGSFSADLVLRDRGSCRPYRGFSHGGPTRHGCQTRRLLTAGTSRGDKRVRDRGSLHRVVGRVPSRIPRRLPRLEQRSETVVCQLDELP